VFSQPLTMTITASKRERIFWSLAIVVCLFTAATFALRLPSAPVVVLAVTGQMHEGCSLRSALAASRYERARMAARNDVANRSELVQQDGELTLWKSPFGRAWIQGSQGSVDARFWAGDFHHWPPRWAQMDVVPTLPVEPGSVVIDAGGHIGESANTALRMGAALVITVEPDPLNAEAIRRNLKDALAAGRLVLVEKALWDRDGGTLTLERHTASTRSTVEEKHSDGVSVPITTIDHIVRELELKRVDFIKMDIEGAEPPALRGARETLTRFKPILAIGSYHNPTDIDEIPQIIRRTVPEYTMTPLRCLISQRRIIPYLLYFHVPQPRTMR
jgi:FkbM family methyltransferase